jgi:hypothetical protein
MGGDDGDPKYSSATPNIFIVKYTSSLHKINVGGVVAGRDVHHLHPGRIVVGPG